MLNGEEELGHYYTQDVPERKRGEPYSIEYTSTYTRRQGRLG